MSLCDVLMVEARRRPGMQDRRGITGHNANQSLQGLKWGVGALAE